MRQIQFWATALVSLSAVLGVGILTPVFISPAASQLTQVAQRPEFTVPNSGGNSTNPSIDRKSQATPSPMPSGTPALESQRALGQFNLSGEWEWKLQKARWQDANENGAINCTAEPGEFKELVAIAQKGNQLDVNVTKSGVGSLAPMLTSQGTLSNNQVNLKGDFHTFTGTVSPDGNQIAGTYTCDTLNLPWTLTRKRS